MGPVEVSAACAQGPLLLPEKKREGEKRSVTGSSPGGSASLLLGVHSVGRGRSFISMHGCDDVWPREEKVAGSALLAEFSLSD